MKVQQAAKSTRQELQWFGGINSFRRKDPLLRWMYEARNDEEHCGLTDSATHKPADYSFKLLKGGPFAADIHLHGPNGPEIVDRETGKVVGQLVKYEPQVSMLQEVTEFDGKKKVPPPTHHLNQQFLPTPQMAAYLGLRWLGQLVAKADAMSKP